MSPKGHSGFSLIELMVSLSIVAILVAIAIPAFNRYRDRAKIAQAQADLRKIRGAVEMLAIDTGEWPGHQAEGRTNTVGANEIWDLNAPNAGLVATDGGFPNWKGPYLDAVPKDPWESDYFFDTDYIIGGRTKVALGSFGPNQVGPNVYDSDNVVIYLVE